MAETDKAEFELLVSVEDATEDELDRLTRQLLKEVQETDVESAELAKGGPAPAGSKGDPIAMGSIAIAVLPAAIPSLIALVQAWVMRGQGRMVKFKGKVGRDTIDFEGPPEELQKLLAALEDGKKKK